MPRVIIWARNRGSSARARSGGCHQTYFRAIARARRSFANRSSRGVRGVLTSKPQGPATGQVYASGRGRSGSGRPERASEGQPKRSSARRTTMRASPMRRVSPAPSKYSRTWMVRFRPIPRGVPERPGVETAVVGRRREPFRHLREAPDGARVKEAVRRHLDQQPAPGRPAEEEGEEAPVHAERAGELGEGRGASPRPHRGGARPCSTAPHRAATAGARARERGDTGPPGPRRPSRTRAPTAAAATSRDRPVPLASSADSAPARSGASSCTRRAAASSPSRRIAPVAARESGRPPAREGRPAPRRSARRGPPPPPAEGSRRPRSGRGPPR